MAPVGKYVVCWHLIRNLPTDLILDPELSESYLREMLGTYPKSWKPHIWEQYYVHVLWPENAQNRESHWVGVENVTSFLTSLPGPRQNHASTTWGSNQSQCVAYCFSRRHGHFKSKKNHGSVSVSQHSLCKVTQVTSMPIAWSTCEPSTRHTQTMCQESCRTSRCLITDEASHPTASWSRVVECQTPASTQEPFLQFWYGTPL